MIRFCRQEHPESISSYGYLYEAIPGVCIYEIHTSDDVQMLLDSYPRSDGDMIDYEALSKDFDGVHLNNSDLGKPGADPHLQLGDCKCTFWFRLDKLRYRCRVKWYKEVLTLDQ